MCRHLAMAWRAWSEEAEYARAKSQSMLTAIQMMRNRWLSAACEAWRARCAALASARAQAEEIIHLMEHRCPCWLLFSAVMVLLWPCHLLRQWLWHVMHTFNTETVRVACALYCGS